MRAAAALAVVLSAGVASGALAQGVDPDLSGSFKLDFAIPESPAFNLLDVSESHILRPANVRELAAAVSQFVGAGGDVTIPRSFAIEFAPALILRGPTLTRSDYQKAAFLYRLRFSAATSRPEDGAEATMVAFGVRTTILDGADLRTNAAGEFYRHLLTAAAATEAQAKTIVQDSLVARGLDPIAAEEVRAMVFEAASRAGRIAALLDAGLSDAQAAEVLAAYERLTRTDLDRIREVRDSLQNSLWNATVVDLAAAVLAQGQEDTPENLGVERWALWGTAGFPLGTWGQFLIGTRLQSERNETTDQLHLQSSLSTRLYIGSNDLKVFAELQGALQEEMNAHLLLNSGGEFNVGRLAWISFALGLEFDRDTDNTNLVTDFVINLATP